MNFPYNPSHYRIPPVPPPYIIEYGDPRDPLKKPKLFFPLPFVAGEPVLAKLDPELASPGALRAHYSDPQNDEAFWAVPYLIQYSDGSLYSFHEVWFPVPRSPLMSMPFALAVVAPFTSTSAVPASLSGPHGRWTSALGAAPSPSSSRPSFASATTIARPALPAGRHIAPLPARGRKTTPQRTSVAFPPFSPSGNTMESRAKSRVHLAASASASRVADGENIPSPERVAPSAGTRQRPHADSSTRSAKRAKLSSDAPPDNDDPRADEDAGLSAPSFAIVDTPVVDQGVLAAFDENGYPLNINLRDDLTTWTPQEGEDWDFRV
ncbi:hypothetical protein EXIGLDRAFT_763693 [Exidia glandulosa HHB12029]|uniref:Uncharacterized protein n=1 Tax=Exidia glandulosa HHB12029 TaxID=1314781 RepID=A0A165LR12_EXIGL|nr:hypothetical protein EXIGLDRAFT_763693 [Exidia glandulosa HHB12029]